MSSEIEVRGFIAFGKWRPIYHDEVRVSELDMTKSKAGLKYLTAIKINPEKNFSGFATAVFGVGGSRNKLIKFKKETKMHNLVIVGSDVADIRVKLNEKRRDIVKELKKVRHDAGMLIMMAALNDYNEANKMIRLDLRAEPFVVEDFVNALTTNGFKAYATNELFNKIDISSIVDEETKVPAKEIERVKDYFVIEHDVNVAFTAAVETMRFKGTAKVMLTGPSGFGKTTAAKQLAKKLGFNFVKVDCSTLQEPTEIVHTISFRDGKTVYDETEFVTAIKAGKCVILFDELNRAYPNVLNTLLPVLDDTRTLTVGTQKYEVADDIVFVATTNIGQQYVGTFSSDAALLNRFSLSAPVGELTGEEEAMIVYHHTKLSMEDSNAVVGVLRELRKTLTHSTMDFSPRTAEAVAMALMAGMEMHAAFRAVLYAISPPEDWKAIIDTLQARGHSYKKPKELLF